ncbi:MAG: aldolase catalytic domain-containing protein [Verrucomicrobiales bacterium]|nr:aldolase catalytic domain-containing protein [Verrucomicrobiales bacterium]
MSDSTDSNMKANFRIPSASGDAGSALRVLDCTIRDGGLMNSHRFEDEVVAAVHSACGAAGIDYMEIGYRASRKGIQSGEHGCWRYCLEEDIQRIVGGRAVGPKISIMADVGKCDYREDIGPKAGSVVDMVRVACYLHQIPTAIDMVKDIRDKGYEVSVNLMAVTTVSERELEEGLARLASSEADIIYVVDSFGALVSPRIRSLMALYLRHAQPAGKSVGIHAHNNLQLAFANTVEAMQAGATFLDATMAGLGRGAGNCPMELLVGFLDSSKYRLEPVLACVEEVVEPLRRELKWGFGLPYMITGLFNRHPRAAIEFLASPHRDGILPFYESESRP